jgi:hypothetical protein
MASEPALAIIRQFDMRVDALYLECFRAFLVPGASPSLSTTHGPTGVSGLVCALCLACAVQGENWLLRPRQSEISVRMCLQTVRTLVL